jgi:2-dehydro-3-deoxy-D-arabinonate dehydratase
MKYYRVLEEFGNVHLCVETNQNELTSLTSLNELVFDYKYLLEISSVTNMKVDEISKNLLRKGKSKTFDLAKLIDSSINKTGPARIIKPIDPDEMWAEGFGNRLILSKDQIDNSDGKNEAAYANPSISTLLYKGSKERLVDPYEKIGIRSDTDRTISEGEVVFIIYKGKFVGISVGNEVAGNLRSQSNFWVSPSKVFKGCASIGPCILSMEDEEENNKPLKLELGINQFRKNEKVGSGSIVTEYKTSPVEIVKSTVIHDSPPDLIIQFSGGFAISRKDDEVVDLQEGDSVQISIENVGYIQNEVEIV